MGLILSNCITEDSTGSTPSTTPSSDNPSDPHQRNEESSPLREWVTDIPTTNSNPPSPSRRRRPNSVSGRVVYHSKMALSSRSVYFKTYTTSKGFLYGGAIIYVLSCSFVSMFAPLLVDCGQQAAVSDFENPGYAFTQDCHRQRQPKLLYMTPMECSFGRRIFLATIFGALIGWERRQADRPAGIRTMSLVSLGACLFSICGTFAFIEGPMGWDASRISAAVPSGVGFLGAGIIWKQTDKETNAQAVHGLTTAASLWLSAAVGIACAGELYFAASFAIAVMMILLRFGPRIVIGEQIGGFSSERDQDSFSGQYEIPREVTGLYRYNSIDVESEDHDASTVKSPMRAQTPVKQRPKKVMRVGLSAPSIRE